RNRYASTFGIELSFARRLGELDPGVRIALIKYARDGTSLDSIAADRYGSWDPRVSAAGGINQYDHFLATVRNALAVTDIDGDGVADRLIPAGFIWMQGEADALHPGAAANYAHRLTAWIGLARAAFDAPDLPVVIGRISDSGSGGPGAVWP